MSDQPVPMPWVKLYTSMLADPRLAVLPESAQLRWYQLLQLAGQLDAGGSLILNGKKLSEQEIAWQLRIAEEALKSDLKSLKSAGLVALNGHGWELSGWMDIQGPSHAQKREAWRERQERHRHKADSHAPVTRDGKPIKRDRPSRHASRVELREEKSQRIKKTLNREEGAKERKPASPRKKEPRAFENLRKAAREGKRG